MASSAPGLTSFLSDYGGVSYVIVFTLFALIIINWLKDRQRNLPPGPLGLPIIGYLPFLTRAPHVKLSKLSKKYGDIMSLKIFNKVVIHLNSYKAIREALLERGEDFNGRIQDMSLFRAVLGGNGILQSEGPPWKEHRRFALHTLRDFGFGKLSLEERILDIAKDLLEIMENTQGRPHDVVSDLSACTANVICSLVFDKHYKMDDPEFLKLRQQLRSLFKKISATAFISSPLIKYVPLRLFPVYKFLKSVKDQFYTLLGKVIEEHKKNFDPSNLRDYTDCFLEQRRLAKESGKLDSTTFTEDRLIANTLTLFFAGTETTSTTLYWALKLLMAYPDVQEKMQKELEEVVGRDRLPSWMDRPNLPYTEATIMEVQRISSILPFVPIHTNPEKTTLRGYNIPKRSIVLANLWAVLRDPGYFPNPDIFDPSRFLNKEGKLERNDHLIPFGIGKRVCLGESLARMELFLFLTCIIHRFKVSSPPGEKEDSQLNDPFLKPGALSYKLCATAR